MFKLLIITFIVSGVLCAGGWEEKNVEEYLLNSSNDLIYSTARAEVDKGLPSGYQFLRVDYVAVQIVAGTNTKYHLTYTNGDNVITYELIVFDQPWTKTTQVTHMKIHSQTEAQKSTL